MASVTMTIRDPTDTVLEDGPKPEATKPVRVGGRAWPRGALGMLAIVIAAELYLESHSIDFASAHSTGWGWTREAIDRESRGARLLCFGTSVTSLDVSARVLEERLGIPVYNFAVAGGQPYSSYTALRHALRAGAKPDAIVVDFVWSSLATPHDWNERVLPELADLAECAELAIASRDPVFLARIALVRCMPSFRNRSEIRAKVAAFARRQKYDRLVDLAAGARNRNVNRGSSHATPLGHLTAINLADPGVFPPAWECTPLSERYLDRFLNLATSRGIPVFWLVPPIAPPVQEHRDEMGLEGRHTLFIKSVSERHPGVVVVDARASKYGAEAFFDMIHLNRDGAVAYTDALSDIIRDRLRATPTGPAWVFMPAYRPDPLASRVEDVSTSHQIVLARALRGRRQ